MHNNNISSEELNLQLKNLTLLNDFSLLISSLNPLKVSDFDKILLFCSKIFDSECLALILRQDKENEFKVVSAKEYGNSKPEWLGLKYTEDSPLGIAFNESLLDNSDQIKLSDIIFIDNIIDSLGAFKAIFDIHKTMIIPLHKEGILFGYLAFKNDNLDYFSNFISVSSYIHKILSSALLNAKIYYSNTEIKYYLSNLIQSSRDAIISLDPKGKIMLWNDGSENIFGYKDHEIIGKNFYYLFSSESRSKVTYEWLELLTGRIIISEEAIGLKQNGQKIFVSYTLSPIYDISNNIIGVSIIFRDLTDKKRMETDISDSKSKLQAIFDSLQDHIILFDLEQNIMMANKKAINFSNMTTKELIGSKAYPLLEQLEENNPIIQTIETKLPVSIDVLSYNDNQFSLKTFPVIDSIGRMTSLILHIKDLKN